MKYLALLFALIGLSACLSTARPSVPGDGEVFAGIGLQFET